MLPGQICAHWSPLSTALAPGSALLRYSWASNHLGRSGAACCSCSPGRTESPSPLGRAQLSAAKPGPSPLLPKTVSACPALPMAPSGRTDLWLLVSSPSSRDHAWIWFGCASRQAHVACVWDRTRHLCARRLPRHPPVAPGVLTGGLLVWNAEPQTLL